MGIFFCSQSLVSLEICGLYRLCSTTAVTSEMARNLEEKKEKKTRTKWLPLPLLLLSTLWTLSYLIQVVRSTKAWNPWDFFEGALATEDNTPFHESPDSPYARRFFKDLKPSYKMTLLILFAFATMAALAYCSISRFFNPASDVWLFVTMKEKKRENFNKYNTFCT